MELDEAHEQYDLLEFQLLEMKAQDEDNVARKMQQLLILDESADSWKVRRAVIHGYCSIYADIFDKLTCR